MNEVMKPFSVSFDRKGTALFVVTVLSSALFFGACGGAGKFAKDLCSSESMVIERKGTKVYLETVGQKLDSLKVSIGVERYKTYSQEMVGYNAMWERLNRDMDRACLEWGICQYKNRNNQSTDACRAAHDTMSARENAAREFALKIKSLENSIYNDTSTVLLTISTPSYPAGSMVYIKTGGGLTLGASTTPVHGVLRLSLPKKFLGETIEIVVSGAGHAPGRQSIVLRQDASVSF